ncbi:MAG: hypothetical protein EA401_09765 [Planctomycetota bacterium]|nr:MAG: hypothetical protein EA401_09765 [Planctomycetota bacterium]
MYSRCFWIVPFLFIAYLGLAGNAVAAEPMERAVDTAEAWADQEGDVAQATDAAPVFSGMLVWSGRADRNYQPFFQWEIRLRGGTEDIRDGRLRITPLGPDLAPLYQRSSHWHRFGNLAAGGSVDFSYFLNTSIFPAYRVEITWRDGEASYLATDRLQLPQREGEAEAIPQLLILNPMWETNNRRQTMVGFWLRNQGGADATGVTLNLRLRDGSGNTLMEHPYVPEDGTIPAGYAQEQRVLIENTPSAFHNIQIGISSDEVQNYQIDGGGFGDGEMVEVAEITAKDGMLHGKLRNGFTYPVHDVTITISLIGQGGSSVGEVVAHVASADAGELVAWSAAVDTDAEWTGFETSLDYAAPEGSDPAAAPTGGGNEGAGMTISVEGLDFTISQVKRGDNQITVSGELHNTSGQDFTGLRVAFQVSGLGEAITMDIGDLAADEQFAVSFVAEGLRQLSGLGMSWETGSR